MQGPTYKELSALYDQLSVDFERLLKTKDRYEHALKNIAAGPPTAGQAYIAKEALEQR